MTDASPSLDLVGTAEAASMLNRDISTITRWVKAENPRLVPAAVLPDVGPKGVLLFHRADVEALAATLREEQLAALPPAPVERSA
jgi:hypothetical protein